MTDKEPLICPNCKCEVPKRLNSMELRMEILSIIGFPISEPRRPTISKDECQAIYDFIKAMPTARSLSKPDSLVVKSGCRLNSLNASKHK